MTATINGHRKMIVKAAIKDYVTHADGDVRPGTEKYDDLMNSVEGQVQSVLADMGEIDY